MKRYLLEGHADLVFAWVRERVPDLNIEGGYEAIGTVTEDRRLLGGVVYTDWIGHDIRMHCAGVPGWLTRGLIRAYFTYPFVQLGCRRVSLIIAKGNKRSRRLAEGLGFRMEGTHPGLLSSGKTAISYGMLAKHCKWIEGEHGQGLAAIPAAA